MVGMFINTLPLRLARPAGTVLDAVRAAQHEVTQALQRAHVPLYLIVQGRGGERSTAYSQLFQVMYHTTTIAESELDELVEGALPTPRATHLVYPSGTPYSHTIPASSPTPCH